MLLALLLTTATAGQVVDLGSGTGHVLVRHDDVAIDFRGGTLTLDGHYATAFQAGIAGRGPIERLTVRNVSIDAADIGNVTAPILLHRETMASMTLENVTIKNTAYAGMAVSNAGKLTVRGLTIEGRAGGVQVDRGATSTILRSVSVVGGRFGLAVADVAPEDAGSIPGLDVDGMTIDMMCSQSPTFEVATATAISSSGITCLHVLAHRSPNDLVRVLVPVCDYDPGRTLRDHRCGVGDRIECDNAWTRVTGIGPNGDRHLDSWREHESMRLVQPEGQAVVYRCFYGGVYGYTEAGITLRNGWRTAAGADMSTPLLSAGHRVDIVRHGITGGPRDYDSGGVHVTKAALNPVLRRISVRDGGSDLVSVRAPGGILSHCHASVGRDYAITVTAHYGAQTLEHCQAESSGVGGFYLGGGASRLVSCRADRNGWNGGGYGFAFHDEPGSEHHDTGSTVTGTGAGNWTALSNRPDAIKPSPFRVARRVTLRKRWRR